MQWVSKKNANDEDEFPVGKLEGLCYLCIRPLDGEMFP